MHSPSFPSWCKVGMAVDAEDRVNGEYYITPKGVAVRVVGDALYTMDDPEFVKKIETKKA